MIAGALSFEQIPKLLTDLSKAHSALRSRKAGSQDLLIRIIQTIEGMCQNNPDAAIAAIHLNKEKSPLKQPIYSAILAELLARRLDYDNEKRRILLCAVLTSNISIVELQVLLNSAKSPLTDQQKKRIERHPQESAKILRNAYIRDEHWLNIIEQHHEKVDGSGYPNQLTGEKIEDDALIIALCEFYTAMIDNRGYRSPMQAREALHELYEKGEDKEKRLHINFIKVIGVYPPGTFVKLMNNEIAIVFKRNAKSVMPMVKSLFDPNGAPYLGGIIRDCNNSTFKITAAHQLQKLPNIDLTDLWR